MLQSQHAEYLLSFELHMQGLERQFVRMEHTYQKNIRAQQLFHVQEVQRLKRELHHYYIGEYESLKATHQRQHVHNFEVFQTSLEPLTLEQLKT